MTRGTFRNTENGQAVPFTGDKLRTLVVSLGINIYKEACSLDLARQHPGNASEFGNDKNVDFPYSFQIQIGLHMLFKWN